MKNQPLELNKNYIANKNLISRRNQDETVIIMKTDNANIFYKIDGLSGQIWQLFQTSANAQDVLNALVVRFNDLPKDKVESDFFGFFNQLLSGSFLETTQEAIPASKNADATSLLSKATAYTFGQIKEFDLAQIETEVLNESIYLDVFAGSDLRLKKDVKPLNNPLEKILSLDGVSFLWNENTASPGAPKNNQIGLVAQQVAATMPDLVKKDSATGILTVNYTKLTPYLVESIKELKVMIDVQNKKIEQLENTIQKLKH